MAKLFTSLQIRELNFKNRIFVSPMCQYSAVEGVPQDWHFAHLGAFAVGGAALVFTEATAVSPLGRISPEDAGIWNEEQVRAFAKINAFIVDQGAVPGIQLAHAGRKASTTAPWFGGKQLPIEQGGWQPWGPSAIAFAEGDRTPLAMTKEQIEKVRAEFRDGAKRALQAGFQVVELHFAHGYLGHEFLSPISNRRTDEYGGLLENRMRFPLQIAQDARDLWPDEWPVFVRISSTDWTEGGWDLPQSIQLARRLKEIGIDLIDCSSGGTVPRVQVPVGPGYQVPFADAIRKEAGIATGAVGLITDPDQAEKIVSSGQADAVFLARELLRDPHWPLRAAAKLGAQVQWPKQYERAKF